MRKALQLIDRSLAVVENSLIVLIVAVMVILAFYQVVSRNLFDKGLLWGDIFLRHLVLWVGFVGASLATRDDKHINIDILNRLTPERFRPYIKTAIELISIAVCIILTRASWKFVQLEMEFNSTIFNEVPAWPFQIIIPIGFALIGFRFLLKILQRFSGAETDPPPQTGSSQV